MSPPPRPGTNFRDPQYFFMNLFSARATEVVWNIFLPSLYRPLYRPLDRPLYSPLYRVPLWWKFSGGEKCNLKNGQSLGFFSLGGSKISGLRSCEVKLGRSVLKFSVDHFVKLMFGLKTTEFLKTWRKSSTKVLQIFVKLIHLVAFLK